MWCSHNDVDLKPTIVDVDGADWVTTLCKACNTRLGEWIRLVDLVDEAIRRKHEASEALEPDWEDELPDVEE